MGLVLAAPADLLAPLVETPQATPAQSAPVDGLFASLLAAVFTTVESESDETLVDTATMPAAPSTDEEEAEKSDTNPFAVLMAMSVALPVTASSTEQPHREWVVSHGEGLSAGVHGWSNSIEVNTEVSELAPTAVAALSAEAAPIATEIPTEAAGAETAVAQPLERPPQPATASSPPTSAATETMASVAPTPARRTNATESLETKPADVTAKTEAGDSGEAITINETQSVVRSVGNAESNETSDRGGNGKEHAAGDATPRALPRASARGVLHAADASAVAQLRTADGPASPESVAPLPTESVALAEAPPQVEQVAQTVIESVEAGRGEARIHLDPAGLGEVTIHVRTDSDQVRVEIHAERHEAMQLLKDHTQDLSNLLGQRGLNLSDVNVGLGRGNSDWTWGREEESRRGPSGSEFASILGIDEPVALDTHNRLRAAYNPDGALVYRV